MLTLYKFTLAPALLWQGAHLRRTALRLPEAVGPRAGVVGAGQLPPLRLLFVGDSSIAGVGVETQDEAMPRLAARALADRLARPVSWQSIARSGVSTREAIDLFMDQATGPADVVVTGLGVNDVTGQRRTGRFLADQVELLARVRQRTGADLAVVTGLPPLHRLPAAPQPLRWYLGQCARRLDRGLARLCASRDDLAFVTLAWARADEMARDRFHPGASQHRRWAAMVADAVAGLLAARGLPPQSICETSFVTR